MQPLDSRSAGTLATTLRNDLLEIPRVHSMIEQLARSVGLNGASLNAIDVALDEILTNIIQYGFNDTDEHRIALRVTIDESHQATVEIEDDGKPFNPLEAPDPAIDESLEERPIGGLGLYLVKQLMDTVEYHRYQGHNLLVLKRSTRE